MYRGLNKLDKKVCLQTHHTQKIVVRIHFCLQKDLLLLLLYANGLVLVYFDLDNELITIIDLKIETNNNSNVCLFLD
jgi:hypothetical protein